MRIQISKGKGQFLGLSVPLKSVENRCLLRLARIRGRILTIYTSYKGFSRKAVSFGSRFDTAPRITVKYPQRPDFTPSTLAPYNCTLTRAIGWPQFALQHHWLLLINCHFRDCTVRWSGHRVSCAIEESDFYLLPFTVHI